MTDAVSCYVYLVIFLAKQCNVISAAQWVTPGKKLVMLTVILTSLENKCALLGVQDWGHRNIPPQQHVCDYSTSHRPQAAKDSPLVCDGDKNHYQTCKNKGLWWILYLILYFLHWNSATDTKQTPEADLDSTQETLTERIDRFKAFCVGDGAWSSLSHRVVV